MAQRSYAHPSRRQAEPAAVPTSPGATREPTPEAVWARTYRRRQASGLACVTIALGREDIDLLCASGVLDGRQDFHSREEVSAALLEFLRLARQA
jgi:hypothetical protein